ncbi:hypothetical protein [Mesoflavibacter zeaxanthinifaciens]|uniref:hypothetical protein n=1 Tax=Mesoflavibacter zeaxanthinifaciens TaxID=393060 RepID=UPI003A950C64
MEKKQILKVLEVLNLIKEGSNSIPVNNLEILVNSNSKTRIIGEAFLALLEQMKHNGLIYSFDNGWSFGISGKGVEYIEENSDYED